MFFSSSLSPRFRACLDHDLPGKALAQVAGHHYQPLVLQNKGLGELNRKDELVRIILFPS
jgi:hypothetical protein